MSTDQPQKIEITDATLAAISGLLGVAHLQEPPVLVVRTIAEATEVFLREELWKIEHPEMVRITNAEKGTPDRELGVPLYGSSEDQRQLIDTISFILIGQDPAMERVDVAAKIADAALTLAMEKGLGLDAAEALIRSAIEAAAAAAGDIKATVQIVEPKPE